MMKKLFNKKILIIACILIMVSFLSFYIWTQVTYEAINSSQIELEETKQLEEGWLIYSAEQADKGLILYPGAKVEANAYAYLAQELSKQNITVAIPSVTLNLPIIDLSKALEMIDGNDAMEWYVGGHSMGGAAAAMFADQQLDKVNGLVLLGSYAADNDYLKESSLPALSISGSEDGLSTPDKIKENSRNIPQTTEFVEIKGGNHAFFGDYGSQKGDNEAQITVSEQQEIIIDTIVQWLESVEFSGGENG